MEEIAKLVVRNPFGAGSRIPERFEWNKELISDQVKKIVADYTGLAYTEDMKKTAKADKATLNAAKKALDERRKAVDKAYKEPLDNFDKEVKEVMALFDVPINQISSYITACEKLEKDKKKSDIEAFYKETAGDLEEKIPLSRIYNPKWLNSTYAMKNIEDEIRKEVYRIQKEIRGLCVIPKQYSAFAEDMYYRTLDLNAVFMEVARQNKLATEKKEERAKAEAEKAVSAVETEKAETVVPAVETAPKTEEHVKEEPSVPRPRMYGATYRVRGTLEQMQGLKDYMIKNGIEFHNL